LGNVQKSVLEGVWDVNGTISKWNGWGRNGAGTSNPPCQVDGIVPRYRLHASCSPDKCSVQKLEMMKQSSFHYMAVHEVMYEMMTSSHIIPLKSSKEVSAPFCGYGKVDENSMEVDADIDMDDDKSTEEDDEDEGSCYVLPGGTSVNLTNSKAGKDLCRLPVSLICLLRFFSTVFVGTHFVLPLSGVAFLGISSIIRPKCNKQQWQSFGGHATPTKAHSQISQRNIGC
jgi:hypothetical protein